jgi:hypothetical protein
VLRKNVEIPVGMENFRETCIWFTGFYEGEGCITNDISNNNKYRILISQNDPEPLLCGQKIWGGSIRERNRVTLTGKQSKGYEWVLYCKNAIKFANDIRPFMKIPYKIDQMNIAIQKSKEGLKDRRFKCKFCINNYASPSGRRRHELVSHHA